MKPNEFVTTSRSAVRDHPKQAAITAAVDSTHRKRIVAMFERGPAHALRMRQQAAEAKRRALRQFPQLLEQAEAALIANGCQVRWATDGPEACRLVLQIAREHNARHIVKSKSMLSEEIGLNAALEAAGLHPVETDLGEYIVQIAHQTPSHIVGPALHLSKDAIRDLFVRELGMPPTDSAEEMTQFVRARLRQSFLAADLGICGGNFVIAETGTIGLATNEGNGRMVSTLPRVLIAVVGIEKIVERFEDYAALAQILARSATGQPLTVYNHMIQGPRRPDEADGPEHVYVVFVDNGRSAIYATSYVETLACLRCGACLNCCPVYRAVGGGHAYGAVYSGPIGAVITPLLLGMEQAHVLPFASTLCGACKDACPVIIDLPRLLLDLRHDSVQEHHSGRAWALGMRAWAWIARSPRRSSALGWLIRWGSRIAPRWLPGPLGGWTRYRDLPPAAPTSFRALWKEHRRPDEIP